jgi:hypothetical protein
LADYGFDLDFQDQIVVVVVVVHVVVKVLDDKDDVDFIVFFTDVVGVSIAVVRITLTFSLGERMLSPDKDICWHQRHDDDDDSGCSVREEVVMDAVDDMESEGIDADENDNGDEGMSGRILFLCFTVLELLLHFDGDGDSCYCCRNDSSSRFNKIRRRLVGSVVVVLVL